MRHFLRRFWLFRPRDVLPSEEFFARFPKKLNLGCGRDYRDGWENWDYSASVKADVHLDIARDVFPSDDKTFDLLYVNGVIEQIASHEGLVHALNECHRVLTDEGVAIFILPNSHFPLTFHDPHDIRHFVPETFRYFSAGTKSYERYGKFYGYKPWRSFQARTDKRGLMSVVLTK